MTEQDKSRAADPIDPNAVTISPYIDKSNGWAAAIYPEDRSWILFVPDATARPRLLPDLIVCVGMRTDENGAPRREYASMNCFRRMPETDKGPINTITAFDYEGAVANKLASG